MLRAELCILDRFPCGELYGMWVQTEAVHHWKAAYLSLRLGRHIHMQMCDTYMHLQNLPKDELNFAAR